MSLRRVESTSTRSPTKSIDCFNVSSAWVEPAARAYLPARTVGGLWRE